MPLGVDCPSCRHAFHVPNNMVGRSIKCPRCEHYFPATGDPAPTGPMSPAAAGTVPNPALAGRTEMPRANPTVAPVEQDLLEAPPEPARPEPVHPPANAVATEPVGTPPMARFTSLTTVPLPPAPMSVPTPLATPVPAPLQRRKPKRRLTSLVVELPGAMVRSVSGGAQGIVSLALIALALGLTAWALTVLTKQALLGIGLGVLGILLGGVAVAALLARKEKGIPLPIAATLVNLQALVLACFASFGPAAATPPPTEYEGKPKPLTSMQALREELKNPDRDTRLKAVFAVNDLARDLKTCAPELMMLLQDEQQPTLRAGAAEALGQIGPRVRISYPLLAETAANDSNQIVRDKATDALMRIGPPGNADVGMLLETLKDQKAKNALLRAAAAQGLGMVPSEVAVTLPALKEALQDGDASVRVNAARSVWVLQGKQAQAEVFAVLADSLKDHDPLVRGRAAEGLAFMTSAAKEAAESLAKLLQDKNIKVRWQAAHALASIGPAAKQTLPQLHTASGFGNDRKVRLYAAVALWAIDRQPQAITVLNEGLKFPETELRQTAAANLFFIADKAAGKHPAELAPAVLPLCAALKDSDAKVRDAAVFALRAIGPDTRAVQPLIEALKHHDPNFRAKVAYALVRFGPLAQEGIPALHTALEDKVAGVRLFAARALWSVERKAKVVVPTLIQLLEEKDGLTRVQAAYALGELQSEARAAVPALNDALKDANNPALQATVAETLGRIGPAARACYPKLSELERDKEIAPEVSKAATLAMRKIGRPTRADVDLLTKALKNPLASYRASAVVTLWLLGKDAKPATKELSKALEDANESVSTTAVYALAAIGPDAADEGAVLPLANALKHASETMRERAAYALGAFGEKAKGAVTALNAILTTDPKTIVRLQAAQALWSINHQTKDVIKVLSDAVQDAEVEPGQRNLAAETLGKIGAKGEAPKLLKELAVPALINVLNDKEENMRAPAAMALGSMGAEGGAAVPALIMALRETQPDIRLAGAEALGQIGAAEQKAKVPVQARVAFAALVFAANLEQNPQVRQAVSTALTKIGPPNAGDVEMLLTTLENQEQALGLRVEAAQVVGLLGSDEGKGAVPRLIKALKNDKEPELRALVANALAGIRQHALSALPGLIEAVRDADPGVRGAAALALGEIGQFAVNPMLAQVSAALETAQADPDDNVRGKAKEALKKIKAVSK